MIKWNSVDHLPDVGEKVICKVKYYDFHEVDYGAGTVQDFGDGPFIRCERTGRYIIVGWVTAEEEKDE